MAALLTEADALRALHARGARRLSAVRFRRNRSTLWSITRRGTVLNLHIGYRQATPEVLDSFVLILRNPDSRARRVLQARRAVRHFPPAVESLREIRRAAAGNGAGRRPRRCAGTPAQRAYLAALYRRLNESHFGDRLPTVPLRFSDRMKRRLGHVHRVEPGGVRRITELALNVDLLLPANDALRLDTMLHEMAHVAAWILDADPGHGRAWKRWARRVGCEPRACRQGRPHRRNGAVTRVPDLALEVVHLPADQPRAE